MKQYIAEKSTNKYKLEVGDSLVLERGFWGGIEVAYAGESSDSRFSLLVTERAFLNNRKQGNLFFPKDRKDIKLGTHQLEILAVNDTSISLNHTLDIPHDFLYKLTPQKLG